MKLIEVTKKDKYDSITHGTYAGYRFNPEHVKALENWIEENNIPNRNKEIHSTLLYSKKPCPNYKALGKLDQPFEVKLSKLENWKDTNTSDSEGVLVYLLDAPQMVDRHNQLMKEHEATYDYEYKPHITISYNVGKDFDISKLSDISNDNKKIQVVEEYSETLDDEWEQED